VRGFAYRGDHAPVPEIRTAQPPIKRQRLAIDTGDMVATYLESFDRIWADALAFTMPLMPECESPLTRSGGLR
jgi:hypothetical protein